MLVKYRWDILVLIILLIAAGVPRLMGLGAFLTADEKNWMGRSYEFIRAFKDWRFNDMLQTTHPGVTTMWVVGAAITVKMLFSHIPFSGQNVHYFVTTAQLSIALLNTLAVPVAYVFLRVRETTQTGPRSLLRNARLVPAWSFLASLFIALDPFLIGYSRVAHVDALMGSLLFLACLAAIIYAQKNYNRRWLVTCAIFSALAILTKIPAIFALPFLIFVMLVHSWPRIDWKARMRDLVLWLMLIVLLCIIVWPAILWVPDPKGNILVLKRDFATAALTPHDMTEDYTLNPWHYPAALITRTTPVTLVFSLVAIISLLLLPLLTKERSPAEGEAGEVKLFWLLIAYIFFFILMMTLGAKKGDRYILPVWPAIDVLAASGVLILARSAWTKRALRSSERDQVLVPAVIGTLLAMALVITDYRYHPYTIAYSNPLFADNLSQELGWGEGLDQVGAWLNAQAPDAVVASWYPEELQAFTSAHVAHINAHEQTNVRYVVLYHNMFGRAPDHPANDFIDEYYKKREPVFVARIAGKEYAWVYEKQIFQRVVGELVPGKVASQQLQVTYQQLAAIDIFPATYSGKAQAGELIVTLRDGQSHQLASWRKPVAKLEDNRWLTLPLPGAINIVGTSVVVEVRAEGTQANNAPTMRQSSSGKLAVRLRYRVSATQTATQEETKLLGGK